MNIPTYVLRDITRQYRMVPIFNGEVQGLHMELCTVPTPTPRNPRGGWSRWTIESGQKFILPIEFPEWEPLGEEEISSDFKIWDEDLFVP